MVRGCCTGHCRYRPMTDLISVFYTDIKCPWINTFGKHYLYDIIPPLWRFTRCTNMVKALRNLTAQSVYISLTQNCLLSFDHGVRCPLPPAGKLMTSFCGTRLEKISYRPFFPSKAYVTRLARLIPLFYFSESIRMA